MVVPVLITNCHVSLYWKIGPVIAQMSTIPVAIMKALGVPVQEAVIAAIFENHFEVF